MKLATSKVLALAFGLGLASGCDGGPPPQSPAEAAHAGTIAPRKIAPLGFEARGKGRPFPFALLEGNVAGQPTRFILDTGASVHTIDTTLAESAKLTTPALASAITVEGWGSLPEHAVSVVALSASLRAHGIGGIIAPQLLVETGQAVVVDFVGKQMRLRPRSAAWSEVGDFGVRLGAEGQGKPCPASAGGIAGILLGLDATLEGEATRFALDSGAGRSTVIESAKGGARAVTHPVLGRTVAPFTSGDVAVDIHGGVPITAGAWSTTVDVGVVTGAPHPTCGYEGRLGIDVLQQCALALAEGEFVVACRTAGAAGH